MPRFWPFLRLSRLLAIALLVSFVLTGCVSGSGDRRSDVRLERLRCESLTNPEGLDARSPRLSWNLVSDRRGVRQTAYQVLVAGSEDALREDRGDLWDSGRVASGLSTQIPYGGAPLESRVRSWWKVRVWDEQERVSAWSPAARFSMGLLRPEDWQAKWIGTEESSAVVATHPLVEVAARWIWAAGVDAANAAPSGTRYFRRTVDVPADRRIRKGELVLAGDNEFAAAVNGEHAGAGSNFKLATAMDVTRSLRPGRNLIAAWVRNAGELPNPAGLIGFLRVEFEDGDPLVVPTDRRWRTWDAEVSGWTLSDFADGDWRAAQELGPAGMSPWGEVSLADEDRRLAARQLRKEFRIDRPVRRATVYFSGLGLSELYLNGRKVGDHVLSPGLTEYTKRVFYLTFDVTDQVRRGSNAIGVWLGNGRYHAPRGKVPTDTLTYGHPRLLLQLEVDYGEGAPERVVSDETWRLTTDGPITANNEYDGEDYDARKEMPGWDRPGFDDRAWQPARVVAAPGGILVAPEIEPIRVTETLRPVRMTEPRPGVFIFDLGQNLVGWCRLTTRGSAGATVQLRHAEGLKEDGTLYLDNIRSARVTDRYTLKGKGTEVYEPRFTYHGFRFVEVTGFPGRPTLETIEGRVVHDDVASAGDWASSNALLDRILRNVRWGVRGNYRSLPTDCPQRDERQGWLGDRSAECVGEAYLFDIEALYRKWVRDMEDAQRPNGSVPDVCPPYWPIYSDNVTWPSSTVLVPAMLWRQYGDTVTVARHYDSMRRWMAHLSGLVTNDLSARDTYGDWCVPPEDPKLIHSQDPLRKTHPEILASGYLIHDLEHLQRFAGLGGRAADARQFEDLAGRLRSALNRKHYRADVGYYDNGSQTACVLPLAFNLVPEGEAPRVMQRLTDKIIGETRRHVGTGLIGGQWLMRTLSDHGQADLAYTIATQSTYPSWGYMVSREATTIWELWNGDTADPAMNSGNHVMLVGDLVIWLYEYLAGIAPDPREPGFRRLILKPRLVGDLSWVRATHRSPQGEIASHWRRDGEAFDWEVRIPPNTVARIHLPSADPEGVTESGQGLAQATGLVVGGVEGGRLVLEVGSGRYRFAGRIRNGK